jgi:hypothetical protein
MIGLIGVFIPIVAVTGFFAWMLALSPVGKAYAERLRGRPRSRGAEDNEDVLEAVEELRREVAELAERVDFTERMLGQQRGGERIGPARP